MGSSVAARRRVLAGLVALGVVLSWSGSARALTVTTEHPRFVFHADSLQALRARMLGPAQPVYAAYKAFIDESIAEPSRHNSYYLCQFAAMYALSGDTSYASAAIPIAMQEVRQGQEIWGEGWYGPGRTSGVLCTYDWCYDRMTEAQRDSIRNAVVAKMQSQPPLYEGAPWLYADNQWSYAYILAGDLGANNDLCITRLQQSIQNLQDEGACLNVLAPNGAIDGYGGPRVMNMIMAADAFKLGTDWDPYAGNSYLSNLSNFWMARIRPDLLWSRMPAKYNTSDCDLGTYFAFFSSRMGNLYSQSAANALASSGAWSQGDGILSGYTFLAYYMPTRASLPLSAAPLDYYDPGMGFVLCRDQLTLSGTGSDLTMGFFNGPDTQQHRTQNHFFIARGGNDLLLDSGYYKADTDDHYPNYYTRAIAHNTVLIYDPSESFGSYTNGYGDSRNVANDGGQQASNQAEGNTLWPTCNGVYGYRGQIQDYEENANYVHLIGDATAAYSSAKVSKVLRRFVYLKPNYFLVQDQIILAKPNLAVRAVFHSVNEPSADVPLQVIQGNTNIGGIFSAPGAKVITINNGASSARIYLLQADGGSAQVQLVGGQAPDGLVWRQNFEPHDTLTYNATQQGYEMWVDGTNYPPGGSNLHPSDLTQRNQGANAAGDWRTEVLVQNAASEVRMAVLIQVVPVGAPLATVTSSVQGDLLSVSVQDGSKNFHIAVCPPGNACGQMVYTQ